MLVPFFISSLSQQVLKTKANTSWYFWTNLVCECLSTILCSHNFNKRVFILSSEPVKQFLDFSLPLEYFLQPCAGIQLGKNRILSQPWKCQETCRNWVFQIRTQNCSVWGFWFVFFGLFFLMVKFGLGLDHFLYDLFIKLLWYVLWLESKFWCLRGCWSPHMVGMEEECTLVVRVVLPELPAEIPQHSMETLVLAEPLC